MARRLLCLAALVAMFALVSCGSDDTVGADTPVRLTATSSNATPTPGVTVIALPRGQPTQPSGLDRLRVATPADIGAFLAQFQGGLQSGAPCQYVSGTVVECGALAFALDEPIAAQGASCEPLAYQGKVVALECRMAQPPQRLVFAVIE